jgi:hypothetical protein
MRLRQSFIATGAMLVVLAVAAYDDYSRKEAAAKVRISGTVTQWSTLGVAEREQAVSFRVGDFPFELGIDAPTVGQMARYGVSEPVGVGSRIEAIVAREDVQLAEARLEQTSGPAPSAIPVLALSVAGEPLFGSPAAFRMTRSMNTWPYLLLLSAAGAAIFFGHQRRRRRSRRLSSR